MKILLILLTTLLGNVIYSQDFSEVKDAIRNDSLFISTTGGMRNSCKFLEYPLYVKNKKYVVYQDCNNRKILNADMQTFKLAETYNYRGIASDKNGIYIKGDFIKTDPSGLFVLGGKEEEIFWKTNSAVYKNTEVLSGVIANEFERLSSQAKTQQNPFYFRDKHNVYYLDKKIEGVDLATVDLSGHGHDRIYDKNYIYKDGEKILLDGEPLTYVNNHLLKTPTKVLYQNRVIKGIDNKTLVGLSRHYAKDKDHVYAYSRSDSLTVLPIEKVDFEKIKVWDHTNSAYLSDGKNLYYYGNLLPKEDFDVATFGTFGYTDFVYDKNGVYFRSYDQILKRDYKKLPFNYTDDVSSQNLQITNGSDLYVFYKNQAYAIHEKILYENLTTEQIEIAKEGKNMHLTKFNGKTLLSTLFDYKFYMTPNGIYANDELTDADPGTFKAINHKYYKDKDHIYYYNRVFGLQKISYIDSQTVEPFMGFIMDKEYLFLNQTRIIKSKDVEFIASFPGYRAGCGLDRTPGSDYMLMKNVEGFWWIKLSTDLTIRYLGKTLDKSLSPLFKDLEIHH